MKYFVMGFVSAIGLVGFGIALAQSTVPVLSNSVISISQEIPVSADLLVPQDDGAEITTTVPFTVGVDLKVTIDGATLVELVIEDTPVLEPAVDVADSVSVPGMVGVDELGIPYTLYAPDGLVLNSWEITEAEDGGLRFDFDVATPGKKFDSSLTAGVEYYDEDGQRIGGSSTLFLGSKSAQDGRTRSYNNAFSCDWGDCAGVVERSKYYVIEFEVDLIDFP